jgi:heme-degrading monooxygenase HmoA
MIATFNSLPVEEGAADRIVERFAESRGHVKGSPGFVSMQVLKSHAEDEVRTSTPRNPLAGPRVLQYLGREPGV